MRWLVTFVVCSIYACGSLDAQYNEAEPARASSPMRSRDMGGGQIVLLHLPIPGGFVVQCTQGAGGNFSHMGISTKHDLDFDTSNTVNEEIYAPVSGVAHVHLVLETGSPFGNHVNIDIGNGRYVTVAHLAQTFVCDECDVAVGQLIAFEGCTGACTGDHVHIGLHEGDASLPAENGTSVEATYLLSKADGTTYTLGSKDFVCGVGGKDDELGQSYRSALPVARAHPDGTLVITPHNPKVYLLENGMRRWITNEQVFWSYGYDFANLVRISDEELNCYPEGPMISEQGLVDAVTDPNGAMWLVVGSFERDDRYRVQVQPLGWQGVLASWGLTFPGGEYPRTVAWDHLYLTSWPIRSGIAQFRPGTLVREATTPAVYVAAPNVAMPVKSWETFLLLGFLSRPIVWVEDGVVLSVQTQVGDCQTQTHCLSIESVSVCGNGSFVASDTSGQGGQIEPPSESRPMPEADPDRAPPSVPHSTPPARVNTSATCPNGALACLGDLNADGTAESLLLADHLWIAQMLDGAPAYVYGNGGCFGGALTADDLVTSVGAYYVVDFSRFAVDCESQITLVSTLGMDGDPLFPDMSNWMWWQGGAFCKQSSPICHLMDNGTPWEEWLLSLAWHPNTGLSATGNGYTSNAQLP